jgi:hypothetical protein
VRRAQNNSITFRDLGYAFSCSHMSSIVTAPAAAPDTLTNPSGDVVFELTIVKVRCWVLLGPTAARTD